MLERSNASGRLPTSDYCRTATDTLHCLGATSHRSVASRHSKVRFQPYKTDELRRKPHLGSDIGHSARRDRLRHLFWNCPDRHVIEATGLIWDGSQLWRRGDEPSS